MNLKRLKFLLNRRLMARIRVDRAAARAVRGDERSRRLLAEARDAYRALKAEIAALQDAVRPAILALEDPREREAMEMRYLLGLSVREIAYRLHFSEQHLFRLVRQGEAKVESDESSAHGMMRMQEVEHGSQILG